MKTSFKDLVDRLNDRHDAILLPGFDEHDDAREVLAAHLAPVSLSGE
jgi:hypothetical protein